jgi:hypothetical protein
VNPKADKGIKQSRRYRQPSVALTRKNGTGNIVRIGTLSLRGSRSPVVEFVVSYENETVMAFRLESKPTLFTKLTVDSAAFAWASTTAISGPTQHHS